MVHLHFESVFSVSAPFFSSCPKVLTHLRVIDERMNQSVGLLFKLPSVSNEIQAQVCKCWLQT